MAPTSTFILEVDNQHSPDDEVPAERVKKEDTDNLLLRLRNGIVDLTNSSLVGRPSIVETGSKVAYMRRLYAELVYDYHFSVFNSVKLRQHLSTIKDATYCQTMLKTF